MTKLNLQFLTLLLTLPLLSAQNNDTFYVSDFGATGDGLTDDTQAFRDAWEAACNAPDSPTIHVPAGKTFLIQPVTFKGQNCKFDTITVMVDGNVSAPSNASDWEKCSGENCGHWIAFVHVDGLYLQGNGTINGKGENWWNLPCNVNHDCKKKPTTLVLSHCSDVHLSQLRFEDSPQMHIALETSTLVHISGLTISARAHSPNTDGIHIQQSKHVFIQDTQIGTGDDCVSIGDGAAYLNISRMSCGPGHGISIGSLGKTKRFETVEFVHVSDVAFVGTTNGVRIKTWQGGKGYARSINFERITSQGSALPIVIDQFYCDHKNCKNNTSAVHVSDVTYNKIWGTSHKPTAVKFACSDSVPCTNIVVNDVNIKTMDEGSETASYCMNVEGKQTGEAIPLVSCLEKDLGPEYLGPSTVT